jgi:hypothetical protein
MKGLVITIAHQLGNFIQQLLQVVICNLVRQTWYQGLGFLSGIAAK